MSQIRCVEMPGATIQEALDSFCSQMASAGVGREDLISIQSTSMANMVKTLTPQTSGGAKVIVTIFYWSRAK